MPSMRRCSIFLRIGETVNRKKKIESHCAKRHPWGAFSFLEMPVKSKKGWRTEKGFSSQVPGRTTDWDTITMFSITGK